jgi:CheY-like chemotaxis protein/HPt (histidine-containing phosphotransfer) domain-containing protein
LLVVEDNEINQILARDLLEAAGAKVVLASDGPEALRAAAAQTPPFDVILMDVQMPGMDGHATTRALRAEAKTGETPIIAMTAHAFDAERKKCLASGMNAHIAKPINPPELVQTVLSWARPKAPSTSAHAGENGQPDVRPVVTAQVSPAGQAPRVSQAPAQRSEPPRTIPASDRPPEQTGFDPSILSAVFREPARQLAFLRKFVDSARRTLTELDGAWQRRSHDEISFAGHKLKSSAKACGAHSLAPVCADLERYGKQPDWAHLDPLRGVADRLLDEVASYVERLESSSPGN